MEIFVMTTVGHAPDELNSSWSPLPRTSSTKTE